MNFIKTYFKGKPVLIRLDQIKGVEELDEGSIIRCISGESYYSSENVEAIISAMKNSL